MKAVIMAGGKGTRISSIARDIPKPMICIEGKPVLEYEIECLRDQGFTDLILTVSYLGHIIMDYFGDGSGVSPVTNKPFGVHIEYFFEQEPMGNAGALFRLNDKLTEEFLLLNADSLFNVDFNRFVAFHRTHGGVATLFTHPNSHPYDSGIILANEDRTVAEWLTKEDPRPAYYQNCVNAGLHILSPKLLASEAPSSKVDLDRQLLKPLAGSGTMYAYNSPEYVKDMGTPERYTAVCQDLRAGRMYDKNLCVPQKAIFLDRDGTLNRYVGFLNHIDQMELLPDTTTAVSKINESGYLAIVVTNQPVIARGDVTRVQLREIHNKLETLLGSEGAYLDGIYYCPHHPHKGFVGEISDLKIECNCRKPKPGLLLEAAQDFHIDLSQSWMVGDSESDILAGKAVGCQTALIGATDDFGQDTHCTSLLEFVQNYVQEGAN